MEKLTTMTRRVVCACACFLLAVAALAAAPSHAQARDWVDVDAPCSLTLEGAPANVEGGARFSLYRVADVGQSGDSYALAGAFAAYEGEVALDAGDQAAWRDLAQTLAGLAARDGVKADAEGAADASGALAFRALTTGLYLVVGSPCSDGALTYTFAPFLVQLPGLIEAADAESGVDTWVYDVSSELKYGTDAEARTQLSALKVWAGDDASARPSSVDVQLLRDGELYDTATLSAENNWRMTWADLDPACNWQVAEASVPAGYAVSVSLENGVFTVTNTAKAEPPAPTGDNPTLPQTGQLWWLVFALLAVGAALCLAGLARRRGSER